VSEIEYRRGAYQNKTIDNIGREGYSILTFKYQKNRKKKKVSSGI
jgi:hypothetical protein